MQIDNLFPWDDSGWLSSYIRAKQLIKSDYPHKYLDFVNALEPVRTRLDFQTIKVDRMFDRETTIEIQDPITKLQQTELKKHEFFKFGRFVVHDLDYFNRRRFRNEHRSH